MSSLRAGLPGSAGPLSPRSDPSAPAGRARSANGAALTSLIAVTVLLGCGRPAAGAQDWTTVTSNREYDGEEQLEVDITYGAGRLSLQPGAESLLYSGTLEYDASTVEPINDYDRGRLRIGIENIRGRSHSDMEEGRLELALGPAALLDLNLKFGAGQAEIELGGLRIRRAEISIGASETAVHFSSPNPEALERFELSAGAASFRATGLGNANAQRFEVNGGAGDIRLDFSGDWQTDASGEIKVGVGSLTLLMPRDIGVRITRRSVLASFDAPGFTQQGNTFSSANWDTADRRLTLNLTTALGSVDVRWLDDAEDS